MNILVVDDERDVKELFEQRFRNEVKTKQFHFAFAYSGQEAMKYMDTHTHEAILILSDINMPGMSGLDLLQHINTKQFKSKPVVIMITAYGDEENYNKAKELGADDFLTKPIDFKLLKDKLNKNG